MTPDFKRKKRDVLVNILYQALVKCKTKMCESQIKHRGPVAYKNIGEEKGGQR